MFSERKLRAHLAGVGLLALSAPVYAAPDGYTTKPTYSLTLPASTSSFGTSADVFGGTLSSKVDGYPLSGHFLAATGSTVFLQKNFGSNIWLPVATIGTDTMDPCFIKISPSGAKIALGTGFYKPIHVFNASLLSVSSPPDLTQTTGVAHFDENYFDGAWRDERYLFLNGATATGSEVYAIDTQHPSGTPLPIVPDIPGASAGVAFDAAGDLVTGLGLDYGPDGTHTGQIKIWPAAAVAAALGGISLSYATGAVLAESALSASPLGFDANGDLYAGGGDVFGASGNYGYAVLVSAEVVQRVLAGGVSADRSDADDFQIVEPDPCHNDDSTGVWYAPSLDMLVVTANLSSTPPDCANIDTTSSGPAGQQYFTQNAPDTDGDGIPDGADNAYLTPNPDQKDTDGDGWGDADDCDADNDGLVDRADLLAFMQAFGSAAGDASFAGGYDLNHDGRLDFADFSSFKQKWGSPAVCE